MIYKDDSRSLVDGNDNPLIMGLTGFRSLRNIQEIPKQFSLLFAAHVPGKAVEPKTQPMAAKGRRIKEIISSGKGATEIVREMIGLLGH